jgi:hypothetical protein
MNRTAILKRRIEDLERARAKRQAENKAALPAPLSMYMIAHFGGHYDPVDSPAMNYVRGLGLDKASDLAKLTPEQRHELHHKAMRKLFKRRGVDLDTASPGEIDAVIIKLGKALAKSKMPVPAGSWMVGVVA